MVAGGQEWGVRADTKEFWGLMEMFYILIVVAVTLMPAFTNICRTLYKKGEFYCM